MPFKQDGDSVGFNSTLGSGITLMHVMVALTLKVHIGSLGVLLDPVWL